MDFNPFWIFRFCWTPYCSSCLWKGGQLAHPLIQWGGDRVTNSSVGMAGVITGVTNSSVSAEGVVEAQWS